MVATASDDFVVTRRLAAPRALVWRAWTEADRLAQWWGPAGTTIRIKTLDPKPGGLFHYSMSGPMGELWGRFGFRELHPPERIVFANAFSDAEGGVVRAPFSATWPLEVLNVLTLSEEDDPGRTTMTLRGGPVDATAAEEATFRAMFPSMQQGFAGTFDQLDAYLAGPGGRA